MHIDTLFTLSPSRGPGEQLHRTGYCGNVPTPSSTGTAFPFALKLVEILMGSKKKEEVQGPMVFPAGAI